MLPDDKDQTMAVMDCCRANHARVLLGELMRRGGQERRRCPSFSKEDFDEIVARVGEWRLLP